MICFLLILLFVYAAVSKIRAYNTFKIRLGNSPFPKSVTVIIVWFVPTIELLVVIMLTATGTRFYGLIAALILLITFTGYIAGTLLSLSDLPCSCGVVINRLSWQEHLCLTFCRTSQHRRSYFGQEITKPNYAIKEIR